MSDLLQKLAGFEENAARLEEQLADPSVAGAPGKYAEVAKELSRVRPIAEAAERYRSTLSAIADARAMLEDPDAEVQELARVELEEKEAEREQLENEIRVLLVPRDPNDEKNVSRKPPAIQRAF